MQRRGFTVLQLLIVLVFLTVLLAVGLVMLSEARRSTRQIKGGSQMNAIQMGLVIWSQSNGDVWPRPSVVDAKGDTIKLAAGEPAESKDTTANVVSILIFNGYVAPEMCVMPLEKNPNIQIFGGYAWKNPPRAVNPAKALWDPAFSVDFTGGKVGGLSYAMAVPDGLYRNAKERQWARLHDVPQAEIAWRGPKVLSVEGETPTARVAGGDAGWQGMVGYSDNHVDHARSLFNGVYATKAGKKRPDCLFFDEADADEHGNNFLGIFIKAGPARKDFAGIWD